MKRKHFKRRIFSYKKQINRIHIIKQKDKISFLYLYHIKQNRIIYPTVTESKLLIRSHLFLIISTRPPSRLENVPSKKIKIMTSATESSRSKEMQ